MQIVLRGAYLETTSYSYLQNLMVYAIKTLLWFTSVMVYIYVNIQGNDYYGLLNELTVPLSRQSAFQYVVVFLGLFTDSADITCPLVIPPPPLNPYLIKQNYFSLERLLFSIIPGALFFYKKGGQSLVINLI